MTSVRNGENKLVCRVDPRSNTVEIVHKGFRTLIILPGNGTYKVINTKDP